jgi:exonuclease SbcD
VIRIAHVSDLHVDERGRLADVVEVLDAFLDQAAASQVDLILIAGDCFERRSTPLERWTLARFLQKASEIAPVFAVKGNHDQAQDLDVFNLLETDHRVMVLDRPTAAPGSAIVWPLKDAKESDTGSKVSVGLLALPWFDKAHLVAQLEATAEQEKTRQLTIAAAQQLLVALRAEASRVRAAGAIPILVSHALVGGSEVSSGQVLIGTTVELAPGDLLDVGAAYVALGHVHMTQEWAGGRVAYSGSPHRCNYGEREAKGWRLVTLDDAGEFVANEFRELPARRMVFLEADFTGAGPGDLSEESVSWPHDARLADVRDALVRFRYRVRAEDLHRVNEELIRTALRRAGAHEVKLEAIVEAEVRVRSAEIVQTQSLTEKVEAFWRAKGIDVDEATRTRVHGKLAQLEA